MCNKLIYTIEEIKDYINILDNVNKEYIGKKELPFVFIREIMGIKSYNIKLKETSDSFIDNIKLPFDYKLYLNSDYSTNKEYSYESYNGIIQTTSNISSIYDDLMSYREKIKIDISNSVSEIAKYIEEVIDTIPKNINNIELYVLKCIETIIKLLNTLLDIINNGYNCIDRILGIFEDIKKEFDRTKMSMPTKYGMVIDAKINSYVDVNLVLYTTKEECFKSLIYDKITDKVIERDGILYIPYDVYNKNISIVVYRFSTEENNIIVKDNYLDKCIISIDEVISLLKIQLYTPMESIIEEYNSLVEYTTNKLNSSFKDLKESSSVTITGSVDKDRISGMQETDKEKAITLFEFNENNYKVYHGDDRFKNRFGLFIEDLRKKIKHSRNIEIFKDSDKDTHGVTFYIVID